MGSNFFYLLLFGLFLIYSTQALPPKLDFSEWFTEFGDMEKQFIADTLQDNHFEEISKLENLKIENQELEKDDNENSYSWFILHDIDQDGYLSGNELLFAFRDIIEQTPGHQYDKHSRGQEHTHNLVQMATVMVDSVMQKEDINKDGYISYQEFQANRLT